MRLTYKQSVDGYTDVGLNPGVTVDEAICKLADFEDADSVEVVRCKDCEHSSGIRLNPNTCVCFKHRVIMFADHFCAWGERRNDG